MTPRWITDEQQRVIKELCEETGTQMMEMPKTEYQASKTIDRLIAWKRAATRARNRRDA